jgi:O-methyltransferase
MRSLLSFARNALSSDPSRRFYAAKLFGEFLVSDFRVSWSQLDWWNDVDFNAYLARFGEDSGMNTQRKWMLWQLLRLVAHVPGDTAECGVFEGASSWLIAAANARKVNSCKHHLFDSFEGLSEPRGEDGRYWAKGSLTAGEEKVAHNLSHFMDDVVFHKGWIPSRFADVAGARFAFVHVDVDLYQPTLDSIRFFYDNLSPQGILLCDDYGFGTCPGATKACDEFLADRPEKMISLDAGGGFFIKGLETGPRNSPVIPV